MSGPGRPQLHPEEIWDVTSVKLSRVNKQFVKANELNLTEFINKAIESVRGSEDYEIKDIEKKILKLESEISIYREKLQQLIIRKEEQEEIKKSLSIQEKYQSFYLFKLYHEGKIDIKRTPFDYIDILSKDPLITNLFSIQGRFLIPIEPDKRYSKEVERVIRNAGGEKKAEGYYIPEPKTVITGPWVEHLDFEKKMLVDDIKANKINGSSTVDDFLKYKPRITDATIAAAVRKEYASTIVISKDRNLKSIIERS